MAKSKTFPFPPHKSRRGVKRDAGCECRFLVIMSEQSEGWYQMKLWECQNECNWLPQPRITSWYWPFNCIFAFFRPSDTLACLAIQKKVKRRKTVRFVKVLTMRPGPREREFRWLMRPFLVRLVFVKCVSLQSSRLSHEKKIKTAVPVPLHFPSVARLASHHSFSTERNILC